MTATTITAGQIITEPGLYDMPIEWYHSDCCAGPSISSSGLRTIESESPAHYWCRSPLNPNREPQEDKAHFALGRAAHMLLLGEAGFAEQFVVRPDTYEDTKTGEVKPWNGNANACKAWLAGQTRGIITTDQLAKIVGMSKSLAAHPLIAAGLLNGEIERSLIWKDAETGIWLKARPDCLPTDANMVADLKTTSSAHALAVRRSIADYGYHMQLALVGMGMEAVLGRRIADDDYILVFVEVSAPYAVNTKPISGDAITYGRRQIRRAIRRFADCLDKGQWPAFDDDGVTAHLPEYFQRQLQQQAEAGLLPEEN